MLIRHGLALVFLNLLLYVPAIQAAQAPPIATDEFGPVTLRMPAQKVQSFAIYFSAGGGRDASDRASVQTLLDHGFEVALIDTGRALARLARRDAACIEIAGALEWVSRNAQRGSGQTYLEPVLLGAGRGGAFVYVALAQAESHAFRGGASFEFDPRLLVAQPFCRVSGTPSERLPAGVKLHAPWVLDGLAAGVDARYAQSASTLSATSVNVATDPEVRVRAALDALEQQAKAGADSLTGIPVIEVGLSSARHTMIVFISGDGGWRDLDKSVAEILARQGYAVIGIDALHYFWSQREPAEAAADIERVIAHYQVMTASRKLVLAGFSFGADVLPFIYNRLPSTRQAALSLLILLAPGRMASFEIHLEEWFGSDEDPAALPIAPELAVIDHQRVYCIYGSEEAETSLCTDAAMAGAHIERIDGGHHFDQDYGALATRIERAIAAVGGSTKLGVDR